jgi:hypothetical protein
MAMRSPLLSVPLLVALLTGALMVTGFAYSKPNPTNPNVMGPGDPATTRIGGPDSGVVFSTVRPHPGFRSDRGGMGVNAFLWRGVSDALGSVPLTSTDSFSGVIVTDWYTPPGALGERLKATVFVLGRDPRREGVPVIVFRPVDKGGHWVDAPVSPMIRRPSKQGSRPSPPVVGPGGRPGIRAPFPILVEVAADFQQFACDG